MKLFSPSLLAIAVASCCQSVAISVHAADQPAHGNAKAEAAAEHITVYGRTNDLVMSSGLATKSQMSLMETPAAIVVLDKELLDSIGAVSLQDIVGQVSGLTQAGNNYGIGDNLSLRGLDANYTYDGMYGGAALGNSFNPTRSNTNVETIEVLKGPATGLYGMGSAGGIINLIEKKPQLQSATTLSTELGQWDSYSVMLDSTGAISADKAVRLVAKHARSAGFRDISTDRDEVYLSGKYFISNQQDLTLSAAYIDDAVQVDSVGDPIRIFNVDNTGIKTPADIGWQDLVNDSKNRGLTLTPAQQQQLYQSLTASDGRTPYALGETSLVSPLTRPNQGEELRLKLNHNIALTEQLQLNQQLQHRNYSSDYVRQTGAYNYVYWNRAGVINADPRSPLLLNDTLYPFSARRQEYRKVDATEQSWQYFADLRYDLSYAGINHEWLLSANAEDRSIELQDWSIWDADQVVKNKAGQTIYQGKLPYIYDIRQPNWGDGQFEDYDPLQTSNYEKGVKAWGIGLQQVSYLSEQWTSRLGLAVNTIDQSYQHFGTDARYSASAASPTPKQDTSDHGLTYAVGLTYQPLEQVSIFANHAKGRTAYSVLGAISGNEKDRKDSESLSYDLGLRVKGADDQWLASVVLFDTARTNLRYNNVDYQAGVSDSSVPEFFYNGSDQSRGVELDFSAKLATSWQLNLNALYQDARNKQQPGTTSYNTRQKGVPYVSSGAWVSYLADWLSLPAPLQLSLGVKYVDKRSADASSFGIPFGYVPSYTLWDAAVKYQQDHWKVQLNLANLLDNEYYSQAMYLGGMPGKSRNARLSASYSF